MGPETVNEPSELNPEQEEQKREEFYNERMLSKQKALGGRLRVSEDTDSDAAESTAGRMTGISPEDSGDEIKDKSDNSRISKRLEGLRKRKRELLSKAQVGSAKTKIGRKYKNIKRVIRVVKVASAAGTSLGDVFISLGTLFLTINLEWIYSKFNKKYPFDSFDRIMFIVGWGIILAVLLVFTILLVIISEFVQNPLMFI